MTTTEYEGEPVPGLPEALPAGETMLWQGAPEWKAVARYVFHARGIAIYFALLAVWAFGRTLHDGGSNGAALGAALSVAMVGGLLLGLIALLAHRIAHSTLYTITSRRVVMRFGIAVPMIVNLPFSKIATADLRHNRDGTGELALSIDGPLPLAFWHLWPHYRPWRLAKAAPMLRCIADPHCVAALLAAAVGTTAKGGAATAGIRVPPTATPTGTESSAVPGLVAA